MVGMSTFDESLHPRGQAANPGQFRRRADYAPSDGLTPREDVTPPPMPDAELSERLSKASETARASLYSANTRAVAAEAEEMMAELRLTAPEGATHAVVSFEEDAWEGATVRGSWFETDGVEVGPIEIDLPLYSVNTDSDMQIAGFERRRMDDGTPNPGLWRIALREPIVAPGTPPKRADPLSVHIRSGMVGQSGTGFADMLVAAASSDEQASAALGKLNRQDFEHLAARYGQFMQEIAQEVRRLEPDDDEARRRSFLPF